MATPWGPLQPLMALLEQKEADLDHRAQDAALVRALTQEDLSAAVRMASLEQLDAVLAYPTLGADRKPTALLLLLAAKAAKMEMLQQRRLSHEAKAQYMAAAAQLVYQAGQFFYRVPVSVAAKDMKRVSAVGAVLAAAAIELQASVKAVFPLQTFLRQFHEHGHAVITPLHGQFFYLCLQAKCYFAAMDILELPLMEIHPQPHLVESVDVLSYAYYGGLLFVGEKRFHEAIDCFLLAITAPAAALSAFVIEAYKKLVLAALIADGEPVLLPKYTPFVVSRHLESHCVPYADLSKAFVVDRDVAAVEQVVEKHRAAFEKDGNLGLVKQSVQALKQRKLLQLTRTYATIELSKLASAAGITKVEGEIETSEIDVEGSRVEAEKMLLQLIADGHMDAVIDKQKAMVTFVLEDEENDDKIDHGDMMRRLQSEMQKLVFVASRLRDMDTEIVTSSKFQHKLHKDKDRRQRLSLHNQQSDEGLDGVASGMDTAE